MSNFKLRQLVKLAELDEEFVNGVIVGLPTKRWPYYEVSFLRWDGSSENMWLTDREMMAGEVEFDHPRESFKPSQGSSNLTSWR